MVFFGLFVGLAILLYVVAHLPQRTSGLRQLQSDLYVIGMIKKIAKEDSIDLLQEYAEAIKFRKRALMRSQSIDETIELNLKEKINESFEKQQEKEDKKK